MASSRQRPLSLIPNTHLFFYAFFLWNANYAFASGVGALAPRQTTTASVGGQSDYTCGPDKPCSNGACCGMSGWCGYGPTYCGDGCQSNCNATSECGEYAATPGAGCPLNVCCSHYGFCGTTTDFCGTGCQSNCNQPKPSAAETNTQKRIVGYWEAWNTQHACGTMSPGEIPVNLLTHLNVAFGYINSAFQVTNMDGLSTDIYKNVGNVKSRNPSLKLIIALGGWSFTDPGQWRSVFPTLVSSEANRATFITNLLGFLSEYGYDGVDFDWEYPGADDRGGSAEDGVNYTALLRELRAAIQASGKDYIVTFTAPTSYWYLRHFDLANMTQYVDWINLMAYDLHGVWDSSDPIGNQVLAHTNLTEIDLALDLFWRVDVDPGKIVLGLGFYGRSFQLTDASCWKPGCAFRGPGIAGECTQTAGILSYREINDILTSTGATAYLDKGAAVRYLVYGNSSWVSYDDDVTFAAKIDYANKMGLAGLMIWAIDLDDAKQDALKAVSGGANGLGALDNPFTLVDLKYLFPTEDLPPSDATPKYGLINFGSLADSGGSMDPSQTAFGFLLIAGDSFAVSNLRRRAGESEPFVFVDCPADVLDAPKNETLTARVVCLSEDVEGCFQVMERGVEGTIIEMPDNCAPNSFARAISLEVAADQYIPSEVLGKRSPTSQVFDFNFDFNFDLVRRDTNNTSLRMDYSNIAGYWKSIVDSPGIQSRSLKEPVLVDHFFAPTNTD
jgi:chitinase